MKIEPDDAAFTSSKLLKDWIAGDEVHKANNHAAKASAYPTTQSLRDIASKPDKA